MGTKPTIENIRATTGVQLLHNWKMNVVKFPNVGTYPDPDEIFWKCTSTGIPKVSSPTVPITSRGHTVHFPSGIKKYSETMEFTFYEDETGTIRDFIKQLSEASSETITGKGNKKAEIEFGLELVTLNNVDADNYRVEMIGCQYEDSNIGSLSAGTSPENMNPTLTIKYDYYIDERVSS
jgi:hypothetical protein